LAEFGGGFDALGHTGESGCCTYPWVAGTFGLREGTLIGVMVLARPVVKPFDPKQIDLPPLSLIRR